MEINVNKLKELYRVFQKESAILQVNVLYVNLHRYDKNRP